ncbi:MAG: Fic family protein [Polyangiaceae bacterium]|nr:Fic family protein [Polyangiaceae bacterium]
MQRERLERVLSSSPEAAAYERVLIDEAQRRKEPRDDLFLEAKPRFEPRREDIVVPLPGLAVREKGGVARLFSDAPAADVPVPGALRRDLERVLAAFDGERTLAEIGWTVDAALLAKVLRAAFGLVLFAPLALGALERRISSVSIVRFPAAPYAIERSYWENMAEVRERFDASGAALETTDGFVRLLRELHVVALMGETLERFYKPASPSSDGGANPGGFWHAHSRLLETPRGAVYLDGPRVLAPKVGGERFFGRLATALGDPDAATDHRESAWGRHTLARGEKDDAVKTWFFPARPVDEPRLEALRVEIASALASADAGREADAIRAAGRFHYKFVRLHPFRCANQSIAMVLVNAVLERAGGGGIPHLALDHLALRLAEPAYEDAFARAASAFRTTEDGSAARLAKAATASRSALALMDAMSRAPSDAAADALAEAEPDAARAALLIPARR